MHQMNKEKVDQLLKDFKGNNFIYGLNCIEKLPELCEGLGKTVAVVFSSPGKSWSAPYHKQILKIITSAGFRMTGGIIAGARPNAPIGDVMHIKNELQEQQPDFVLSVGGGSSIDATKAAIALAVFEDVEPDLENYFGMNMVSGFIEKYNRNLIPMVAVQVAAGSAAHLTKYSNITNMSTGQKLLIIDEAITPPKALFDYSFTKSGSKSLTMDGAFDGISHCLEVLMGIPDNQYDKVRDICLTGIELIVNNVVDAVSNPFNEKAREALGLGTDLGGYAIMVGGTNGAHLNSFSLTRLLSHGRAVALLNPYYVVFFATAIPERLKDLAVIYQNAGWLDKNITTEDPRALGEALAGAMIRLSKSIGFPTQLREVDGFEDHYIDRCIEAAKNPKLESKLKNMPIPLNSQTIDTYMRPVLLAAKTGNLNEIISYRE